MKQWIQGLCALALCLMISQCIEPNSNLGQNSSAPSDHTLSMSGVMHKPGLQMASTNCTSCHGSALKGGEVASVSCYTCHGKLWR